MRAMVMSMIRKSVGMGTKKAKYFPNTSFKRRAIMEANMIVMTMNISHVVVSVLPPPVGYLRYCQIEK